MKVNESWNISLLVVLIVPHCKVGKIKMIKIVNIGSIVQLLHSLMNYKEIETVFITKAISAYLLEQTFFHFKITSKK